MSKISDYEEIQDLTGYWGIATTQSDTKKFPILKSGLPFWLAQSAVAVPLTGTLSETLLASVLIPAGTIGANGRIRISHVWSNNNSGNNKTRNIRFGSAAGVSGSLVTAIASTTNLSHYNEHVLCNRNDQASQIGNVPATATGGPGSFASASFTSTVNTAADSYINFTGTLANTGDTITLEHYLIEVFYKE